MGHDSNIDLFSILEIHKNLLFSVATMPSASSLKHREGYKYMFQNIEYTHANMHFKEHASICLLTVKKMRVKNLFFKLEQKHITHQSFCFLTVSSPCYKT